MFLSYFSSSSFQDIPLIREKLYQIIECGLVSWLKLKDSKEALRKVKIRENSTCFIEIFFFSLS